MYRKFIKNERQSFDRFNKILLFLTSVLVLIFFVRYRVIELPSLLYIKFSKFGEIYFIFTFLLIGNLVSLVYAGAMLKICVLEAMIGLFVERKSHKAERYLSHLIAHFFVYIYDFLNFIENDSIHKWIINASRCIHVFMLLAVPIVYIAFYIFVLISCLIFIWDGGNSSPSPGIIGAFFSGNAETAIPTDFPDIQRKFLCGTLLIANLITLPIYLFTFIPVPTKRLSMEEAREAIEQRAYFLWKEAGCPPEQDEFFWHIAELQIRTLGSASRSS